MNHVMTPTIRLVAAGFGALCLALPAYSQQNQPGRDLAQLKKAAYNIDKHVATLYKRKKLKVPEVVDDATFLRRSFLVAAGRIPTLEEARMFLEIEDADKSRRFELHWRCEYFGSNFEVLKQATSVAGELMALSGKRNPYPGKLGVIEAGAWADLLIVNGDPLDDITVLADPEANLSLIMKNGVIYKNTLDD